jgi:hypothetical protein
MNQDHSRVVKILDFIGALCGIRTHGPRIVNPLRALGAKPLAVAWASAKHLIN